MNIEATLNEAVIKEFLAKTDLKDLRLDLKTLFFLALKSPGLQDYDHYSMTSFVDSYESIQKFLNDLSVPIE